MEIDFSAKKSEAEWSDTLGAFLPALGEQILKLVEWVIVIAALYVAEQNASIPQISILKAAAIFGLFSYLQGFFLYRLRIRLFSESTTKIKMWLEIILNVGIAAGVFMALWLFALSSATAIADSGGLG